MNKQEYPQLRILIVEDDEDDYFLTEDLLSEIEGTEFDLEWVKNYEAAVTALQQKKYDVYLFDYRLGDRSGLDLLRFVVASRCKTPVIMLTGQQEREKDLEAMQAGAADYLVKGEITASLLERSIRYAINRAQTLEALQESEEQYALAAAGANDGLWDWNLTTNEVYFSGRWKSMLGLSEEQNFNGLEEWLNRIYPEDLDRFKSRLLDHLHGVASFFEVEYRIRHQNGTYLWVLSRGLAVRTDDGKAYRIAGSQTDLSSRRVLYDQLTGLSNRTLFLDQLERALKRTKRQPDYLFAVIFLDCDRFKLINDSLGHLTGDKLLIGVAERLQACLRPGDIVARLGGDEFTVLLENVKGVSDATKVASRINEELKRPFWIDEQVIYITASIGIAFNSEDCHQPEDLLRNADTAMYRAKALGKARYEVFDRTMYAQAQASLQLETDLRLAIERKEFQLYYQPIISLGNNNLIGFEALIRWHHPQQGLISPAYFIPVAEETGLIIPISQWIFEEACRQMQLWQQQFSNSESLIISVNLSRKLFSQPKLAEEIELILQKTGLKASSLKLEVTETALVDEDEAAVASILSQIKDLGVKLSVDDFGTGYSSLSCLHQFPIDTLKIDRSFICRMSVESKYSEIVKAIITLAHSLGLRAIAEGVETSNQLLALQTLHCDYAQGYLFSQPLSASNIEASWLSFQKQKAS